MNWNEFRETPHRRWNPLLREWVLVSPQRSQRPWLGQVAKPAASPQIEYDPECYLCPGNARSQGLRNPVYESTFVFDNDFPALLPDVPEGRYERDGLIVARTERGIRRVGALLGGVALRNAGLEPASFLEPRGVKRKREKRPGRHPAASYDSIR